MEAGVAIIINPEAGEVFYLDREERRRIVEVAVDQVAGRGPVVAGVIDNTTEGAVAVRRGSGGSRLSTNPSEEAKGVCQHNGGVSRVGRSVQLTGHTGHPSRVGGAVDVF